MNKLKHKIILGLVATFLLGSAPAMAVPLNLNLADQPDIVSLLITVDYNASTDALTATGQALQLDLPPVNPITGVCGGGGCFNLSATIDNLGNLSPGGTLNIDGMIAGLGFNSGTLLTGDLTVVGGNPVGGLLEFLFAVTGGDAAGLYGGIGATGGIIMSGTGFTDWNNTFGAQFSARADVAPFPAPEPPMLLLGMGIFLIALRLKSKS